MFSRTEGTPAKVGHSRARARSAARVAPVLAYMLGCVFQPSLAQAEDPAGVTSRKPNVIVCLLDATRADYLSCYGYPKPTSPAIDALAARGVLCLTASSQASWTKPSVPSLFTGLYPIQHRVFEGNTRDRAGAVTSDRLDDRRHTMAEIFQKAGYATVAFTHNVQISAALGFGQGFEVYAEEVGDASAIADRFLEWRAAGDERPYFAYLHFLDPHWPYLPPLDLAAKFTSGTESSFDWNRVSWKALQQDLRSGARTLTEGDLAAMQGRYAAEIRHCDDAIARIVAALTARGEFDHTILLVTADHGEEFLDHANVGHGESLYQELLHVPLVLSGPGIAQGRIERPVETIDILPTLLSAAGLDPRPGLPGKSLLTPSDPRPVFADHRADGEHGPIQQAVRDGNWKLIRTERGRLQGAVVDEDWMPPPIAAGSWLEIEGLMQEDQSFLGTEVEPIVDEEEVKISGPIAGYDANARGLTLLGIPCRLLPDAKFKSESGKKLHGVRLADGQWIQAKGSWTDGVLKVRSIKVPDPTTEPKMELKGRVDVVEPTADGYLSLRIAGLDILLDDDTEFDGEWPGWTPPAPAPLVATEAAVDANAPRELIKVELFDLSRDPHEQNDLAKKEKKVVDRLLLLLDAWNLELSPKEADAAPVTLDPQTLERLRSLGYIR